MASTARTPARSGRPRALAAQLPHVGAAAAAASRLLHDARFAGYCAGVDVAFAPAARAPDGPVRCLAVECDHGVIELLVDTSENVALSIAASADTDLPAALQQLAAEALLAPVFGAMQEMGVGGARVLGWQPFTPAGPAAAPSWCSARHAGREFARFAVTRWPARVSDVLVHGPLRRRAHGALRRRIALRGAVTLCERPVSRSLWRSLAPGDVLLLSAADRLDNGASAWIRFGVAGARRLRAAVHVDDDTITLQERLAMTEDSYEEELEEPVEDLDAAPERDDGTAEGAPEADDALGELDIPVRFEIDTVAVSLADLEAMEPGYVIELRTPLAVAQVRLVACGRVVGHAELVAVGERLGARISRLATHHADQSAA